MSDGRFTKGTAQQAGAKGGRAKQAKHLSLEQVEQAFGSLVTVEDAQRRLERLGVWASAGLLAGSVGGVAVRSVEVWLRAHESQLTETVVTELRGRLDELEGQLRQSRPRVVR